ncbi:MAG TPA: alpha/beta fold hydrolase [Gemmatimonadales bacterium]|nr:alpha/beta fold hydrolase [Gemmatimonadales bacterium]
MKRLLLCWLGITACRAAAIPEAGRFPAGTGFVARRVWIDGTSIRYIDSGTGPAVMYLHGLGASMYAWRKNLAPIAAAGYRVVAFDNRGFGFSDKPASGYDNGSYVRLVVALLDSLHVPYAVLVGHSMGGAIAAQVALAHPERVRGLVLIGSAGLGVREPILLRVGRWPVLGPLVLALRGRAVTRRLLEATYADPRKVSAADIDQYYAPVAEPDYGRGLHGVLREFRFDCLTDQLEHIAPPTLVLWGEEDRLIPIALGRTLAAGIPHAAFLSVPQAGHAVQEEAPGEVNRLLLRFLKDGLARVPGDLATRQTRQYISSTIRLIKRDREA